MRKERGEVSAPSGRPRRYIVHVDIDAFFASVEVLLDPSLAGKPVIVGGLAHERGVASTCSYEARKFGVHSGMPLRECYKLCPEGVFVRGNYQVYEAFSERFFRVLTSRPCPASAPRPRSSCG